MKFRLHHLAYAVLLVGIIVRVYCWPINSSLGMVQRFAGSAILCVPYLVLAVTAWVVRHDVLLTLLVLAGSCVAISYGALFDYDHLRRLSKESGFDALEVFQHLGIIGLFAAVVLALYSIRRTRTNESKS